MAEDADKSAVEKVWSCFLARGGRNWLLSKKHRVDNFSQLATLLTNLQSSPSLSSTSNDSLTECFTLMPFGEDKINRKQKKSTLKEGSIFRRLWRLSAQLYIHLSLLTLLMPTKTSHQVLSSRLDRQNKKMLTYTYQSRRIAVTSFLLFKYGVMNPTTTDHNGI